MSSLGLIGSLLASTVAAAGPTGTGVGVVLGEPAGLTVAYRFDDRLRIQSAMGWSFGQRQVHLGADGVVTVTEMAADEEMGLTYPVYMGLGFRVRLGGPQTPAIEDRSSAGFRFPLGVAIMPEQFPLEVFFEVAPILLITPSVRGGFDGGLGARVYF